MQEMTIEAPTDFHVHLREEEMLSVVAPETARSFARALVMPNLAKPIETGEMAVAYRSEINRAVPDLEVLMTMYLTERTTPDMIIAARALRVVAGKAYFRNKEKPGTTNAHHGLLVDNLPKMRDVFTAMRDYRMVLCLHMEIPYGPLGTREILGIGLYQRIREMVPDLKIVIEHVSNALTIDVAKNDPNTAFTVTPHHLWLNDDETRGNHHHHCMPVVKSEADRQGLIRAVTSGHPRIGAGTDSAPHARARKNVAEGPPAGVFCAPAAIDCYATIFEDAKALGLLENFLSHNLARFYCLPNCRPTMRLWQNDDESATTPELVGDVVPFRHGERLRWQSALVY